MRYVRKTKRRLKCRICGRLTNKTYPYDFWDWREAWNQKAIRLSAKRYEEMENEEIIMGEKGLRDFIPLCSQYCRKKYEERYPYAERVPLKVLEIDRESRIRAKEWERMKLAKFNPAHRKHKL
jgi:hypothetical protein